MKFVEVVVAIVATVPLFVVVFTDATFHDPDVEANYPFPGATSAGRSDVIAQFPNTGIGDDGVSPSSAIVFGMVPGLGTPSLPDLPQLEEIADLSGGDVFPLGTDSSGFVQALERAVDTTPLPVLKPLLLLQDLTVYSAVIHWQHGHVQPGQDAEPVDQGRRMDQGDERPAGGRPDRFDSQRSLLRLSGRLALREGGNFQDLVPTSKIANGLSERPLLQDVFDFEVDAVEEGTRWRFRDSRGNFTKSMDSGITRAEILWTSPSEASYLLEAEFVSIPQQARMDPSLELVVSLGEPMLSRDTDVPQPRWVVADDQHWRAGPESTDAGRVLDESLERTPSGGLGCALFARAGAARSGAPWLLFGLGLALLLRRRRLERRRA